MRRFLRALRVAFWSALHAETSRRAHELTIVIHVETTDAQQAIAALDDQVAQLCAKADYAARVMGKIH